MAILNLTPDSFSDGIKGADVKDFLLKADKLIDEGADILDIGGESTRPGAEILSLAEERSRVLPFLQAFRKLNPDFPISLDTKKYDLAKEAAHYNIQLLNDVSFLSDPRFIDLAIAHDCHYVLMHSRGDSQSMTQMTEYPEGLVKTMESEINEKLSLIRGFGFEKIIIDLGFGFAKTPDQCVELINHLGIWREYFGNKFSFLLGISRKRFLQKYTGENSPVDRDEVSAELALQAYKQGFQIIRTHNPELTCRLLRNTKA